MSYNLERFLIAQSSMFARALAEIQAGEKRSHWIWYIFPQMKGLGFSEKADYYGIKSLEEATEYLQHPILGPRLLQISRMLLNLDSKEPDKIMGYPDNLKLQSSMTLFAHVPGADSVFSEVLSKFFDGRQDDKTLQLLSNKG